MTKNRVMSVLIIGMILAIVLTFTAGQGFAADKKIRWKGQSCFYHLLFTLSLADPIFIFSVHPEMK